MPCHPECRSEPRIAVELPEDERRRGSPGPCVPCHSPNAVLAKYFCWQRSYCSPPLPGPIASPVPEAKKHVGEVKCVTGIVVRVKQGARGVHFLDFCDDFRLCPFTVVIFPRDLKSVGDVRQLQGRMVEIHGQVKEYDGRAEIILEEYRQLAAQAPESPRCPRTTTWRKKAATAPEPSAIPKRREKPPSDNRRKW